MMTRVYTLKKGETMKDAARKIKNFLNDDMMNVQCVETTDGTILIQAKENIITVLKLIGCDRAITVKLTSMGDNRIMIEMGEGKWMDKIVGGLAGFVFWPAFFTTAFTMYNQATLPQEIMRCLNYN